MKHELDTRRLLCPMPVIKTQDKVKAMKSGDTLNIVCTDPGAIHDIPAWCRIHGHQVISIDTVEKEIIIHIRIGANDAD